MRQVGLLTAETPGDDVYAQECSVDGVKIRDALAPRPLTDTLHLLR